MKILALLILVSLQAFAGFGGSRSGGFGGGRSSFSSGRSSFGSSRSSFSSGRSSSFGGSRSSSSSVTITRPSSSSGGSWFSNRSSMPSRTIIREVPVYHDSGGSHFWTNFWMYQAIMGNRPQQTIVTTQPGIVAPQGEYQPQFVEASSGHGFFYYFFLTIFWGVVIFVCVYLLKKWIDR